MEEWNGVEWKEGKKEPGMDKERNWRTVAPGPNTSSRNIMSIDRMLAYTYSSRRALTTQVLAFSHIVTFTILLDLRFEFGAYLQQPLPRCA